MEQRDVEHDGKKLQLQAQARAVHQVSNPGQTKGSQERLQDVERCTEAEWRWLG